jgi:hypothetical protein
VERLGVGDHRRADPDAAPSGQGWFTEAVIFQTATVPAARASTEVEALEEALEAEPALVEEPDALGVSE